METAGYIIVGSIYERITFGAFLLCELFVGALLYPIFGCWVWGGGWMSQLGATMGLGHGYVDFAGSTVVHAVGGFCAMALAVILGPRLGKYDARGKPVAFPAHNLAFVVTGTFILLFGWMGFNPASTLGATDLRISIVAVNTNLAAVAGSASAMLVWYLLFGKPRHHHGLQRDAGGTGRHHRAVRVRQRGLGGHHWRDCGRDRVRRRPAQRTGLEGGRPVRRHLGSPILRVVRGGRRRHLRGRIVRFRVERHRSRVVLGSGGEGRDWPAAR
jgi:hypothetical protein